MTTILIVEDNAVNRKVLLKQVEMLGYQVLAATNGEEALTIWDQQVIDLIFMDCLMPVIDGYEATAIIRQRERENLGKKSVIIGLTASALPGDREKCLAAGMDDYLAKPAFVADLKRVFSRWLPQEVAQTLPKKRISQTTDDYGGDRPLCFNP